MKVFKIKTTLIAILATSNLMAAGFGPWPTKYFLGDARFSCVEESPCIAPRLDDLSELRSDFAKLAPSRLDHLQKLTDEINKESERFLVLAQKVNEQEGDNLFSNVYTEVGSAIKEISEKSAVEKAKLFVSESSPMLEQIANLENFIAEWDRKIEEQTDQSLKDGLKLLKKEKYKELYLSEDFQFILSEMKSVETGFFVELDDQQRSKQIKKILESVYDLSAHFEVDDKCPKFVKDYAVKSIGKLQVSAGMAKDSELDPFQDSSVVRMILNGKRSGNALKIYCKKSGFLSGVSPKYDDKDNELKMRYKEKLNTDGTVKFSLPKASAIKAAIAKEL
tara:strand:+ start:83949 stop:84953 length:1005 start_codon:yes stop_codon:yes gene_type:complete